jgi:UDPglucose 6-dehydrogenase
MDNDLKISVIGSGYVGLVSGMGFVKLGFTVTFIDIDEKKLASINQGIPPIYEEGLEELMQEFKDRYSATSNYDEAIQNTDITFISVGTPSDDDGSIDLKYVKGASADLGAALKKKDGYHVVVVKSTVIPRTTDEIVKPILEEHSGKNAGVDFGLAMNPEFLREGVALRDFLGPDRIVIGLHDDRTKEYMEDVYASFDVPKLYVDIRTAEMIKYTSNAFLATKISFANEIGNACKILGIDTYDVFEGVGLDSRISPAFFRSGAGFGGSCFPKDVKALIKKMDDVAEKPRILKAVMDVNDTQPLRLIELMKKHVGEISGKPVGLLGLAFKPDSDDIRETRAVPIVNKLLSEGAKIIAFDPKAIEMFKAEFPDLEYTGTAEDVLARAEVVIIQTDWAEFNELDYSGKIVIDGRRMDGAMKTAKVYEGICW